MVREIHRHRRPLVARHSRSGRSLANLLNAMIVVGLIVLAAWLLLPSLGGHPPEARWRSACKNNLKQLGLALHNYHDFYESFPPAHVVDENGTPLYSWRVLLLPFLEQEPLYDQLHLDEPWDSPHNRPLLDVDVAPFRCPSEHAAVAEGDHKGIGITNYVAVVGPETMWPQHDSVTFRDVTDGNIRTILVVEVANSGIHWAEPRDLHVTQMAREINPTAGMGLSSRHDGGMHILWGDGSVRFLSDATPPETVRALLTRAGGEEISGEL